MEALNFKAQVFDISLDRDVVTIVRFNEELCANVTNNGEHRWISCRSYMMTSYSATWYNRIISYPSCRLRLINAGRLRKRRKPTLDR